ncbi:AAA family ATPase [Sporosarcina sp. P20a]|uniref:AAA family ATPase n=1 Tax=Sporosarcina sp. P20a TaxID=2048256 RepID=UPI000C1701D4|nr:AAA family ATPase [Sporosarcina sp. P20a]PIC87993.1 AAA family ATPase [Sporosarcina sp. P20a]
MIITNVNEGTKAKVGLSGTTLKIGGQVFIDLASKQKDVQHVVDVCLDNQLETMREGLGAWYVATIVIPARQYEFVPNGEDDEGEMQYKRVERALDLSTIELRLWALPEGYGQEKATLNEQELNEGGIQ